MPYGKILVDQVESSTGKVLNTGQVTSELNAIARSLNVADTAVIYSTDTVTLLDNVQYIYDATVQVTWAKPAAVGAGEAIVTVAGNSLTTSSGVYVLEELRVTRTFDTLQDAVDSETLVVGDTAVLKERIAGNGGGSVWDVVLASTVTPNGFNIVQCAGASSLALVLDLDDINVLQFGAKLDGSEDVSSAFIAAVATAQRVTVPKGNYSFTTKATFSTYAHLHFERSVTMSFDGSDDYMLEFNGGMQFSGDNVTIDFKTNDTVSGIYVGLGIPTIIMANCILRNSIGHSLLSENATGNGKLDNVTSDDCGRGVHVYGTEEDPLSSKATLVVNNMITLGTTGTVGNIYYFQQLNRVEINGGDFTGDNSSGPNCYRCSSVYINGGTYYNINRGPTVGKRTKNFVISGTRSINCSYAALAPDLADEPLTPDEYPSGYGVVSNNVGVDCGYGCRWQGDDGIISNNFFSGCTTSDGIIRVNADIDTGSPVLVQNNYIVDAGSLVAIRCGAETEVLMRDNITDSTATTAFTSDQDVTSSMIYGEVEVHSSSFDVRTNVDIMSIDVGVSDIDLPSNGFGKCQGKEFTFVRGTNVSNVSLTINNGSPANGTVNGGSSYSWPPEHQICKAICVTNSNNFIVSSY